MTKQEIVEQFGQLFVMAFDGSRLRPDVAEFLRVFQVGGVILFADNYRDPRQLTELCRTLQAVGRQSTDPPLLIATDHEGGRVQRFVEGFTRIPSAADLGRGDASRTGRYHRLAARELRSAGINVNLAPVADLCPHDRPGAIGARSFGDDPGRVAQHVKAAIHAIQGEGLIACVKHFPGHGATGDDSHRVLPRIDSPLERLERRDLVPFGAAIRAGTKAVMTGHVLYPDAGDAERPASLSPYWHRFVRRRMGFDGLIVTDALEMGGLRKQWEPVDAGVAALEAGADVLIFYKESSQFEALYHLREAVRRGELDARCIERSLERLRRAKTQLFGQEACRGS